MFDLHKADIVFWAGDFNFRSFYKESIFNKKQTLESSDKQKPESAEPEVDEKRLYSLKEVLDKRAEIIKEDELSKFNFNKIASSFGFHHPKLP